MRNSESDLAVLADGIAKLEDELARANVGDDRAELEALLELARDTYVVVQAKLDKKKPSLRRRPFADPGRPALFLHQAGRA
jgi:hypothetical protein